jgi:taurine dioxygenase
MQVDRLANALGAEVVGLDLSAPLADDLQRELRAHWLEHKVLLFRGQHLTPPQLLAFTRRFGELERHDSYPQHLRHPDHAELLLVKASEIDGRRVTFGQQWHGDLTYTLCPAAGACLYCLTMPPVGGDTVFANIEMALAALSPTLRTLLDRLEAVHDITHGRSFARATAAQLEAARLRNPPVIQPVVRRHPETGRSGLFISEWMCSRFAGMTEDESAGLLRFLNAHCVREEFTLRQRWQVGDVLLWDNRSTIHVALADYPSQADRKLLRASIIGEPLGRPCNLPEEEPT